MIEIPDQLKDSSLKFILIKEKDKLPLEKWLDNYYSFDDERLLYYLRKGYNYGLICGNGIIVIDADTKELNEIIIKNFKETFAVKTAKGYHYYYYAIGFDKKKVLKNENKHLGEIQSNGTYVICPGSIHPSGIKYEIVKNIPITDLTSEEINNVLNKYYSTERVTKEVILTGAGKGLRNDSMFRLACSFREKEMNEEEVYVVLSSINKNNSPPLPDYELKIIIESAFKYKNTSKKINAPQFNLPIDNYMDNALKFHQYQPFFYDRTGMFWFWNINEFKYELVDDVDVMNKFDKILGFKGQTISSKIKINTLEAMKRVGRDKIPKEAKKKWIQFKDKAYSIYSGKIHDVTPDYLFTNPIPWEIGDSDETPTIDKLFCEWVGEQYVITLYEIIAYCCLSDYPIHLIFCFVGCGRNGKSRFIALLNKFIGKENICSTELDTLLDSRFESFKLYRKLVCCLGETNFGILNKTSMLKKLTGQDLIGYEYKHKTPFDDYNYAKIVISSNSLPTSEDTSEGFYRRWLIVDFPNIFKEGKDILDTIPEIEYLNLARKIMKILPPLLDKGEFTNQGSIEERKDRYILSSNPLPKFISLTCQKGSDLFVKYSELYTAYVHFLNVNKKRVVSKREFGSILLTESLEVSRTSKKINNLWVNDRYILGLELLPKWEKFVTFVTFNHRNQLSSHVGGVKWKLVHESHKSHETKKPPNVDEIEEEIYDKTLKDFEKFVQKNDKDNYQKAADIFGEDLIENWLKIGEISEPKAGTLIILK